MVSFTTKQRLLVLLLSCEHPLLEPRSLVRWDSGEVFEMGFWLMLMAQNSHFSHKTSISERVERGRSLHIVAVDFRSVSVVLWAGLSVTIFRYTWMDDGCLQGSDK